MIIYQRHKKSNFHIWYYFRNTSPLLEESILISLAILINLIPSYHSLWLCFSTILQTIMYLISRKRQKPSCTWRKNGKSGHRLKHGFHTCTFGITVLKVMLSQKHVSQKNNYDIKCYIIKGFVRFNFLCAHVSRNNINISPNGIAYMHCTIFICLTNDK